MGRLRRLPQRAPRGHPSQPQPSEGCFRKGLTVVDNDPVSCLSPKANTAFYKISWKWVQDWA